MTLLDAHVGAYIDDAMERDALNHPTHPDDLVKTCVWPNGVECEYSEREEYLSWMSDDYAVVMK